MTTKIKDFEFSSGFNNKSQDNKSSNSIVQKLVSSTTLIALGAGLAIGGTQLFNAKLGAETLTKSSILPLAETISSPANAIQVPSNFVAAVVQQVGPAVVRIDAQRTVENQVPEALNDPFFRRFFGEQIPNIPERQIQSGTGSGFIIDSKGEIITNAHVVDGASKVTVTLKDGRQFEGKVVGKDPVTDVAVIHIEAENLPTVKLGNSEQLQPGEWAIAIGNPLGLDSTVTTGIISATGRSSAQIGVPDKRVEFIQTDAAINPGNSGGPLLNQNGEVIGVNTAILQGAQGLGFAIPINTVQQIAAELVANGKVEHPFLGIQMLTLTPELKNELNSDPNSGIIINQDQGVLIMGVVPNSPAENAGLRAGDVIEKVNGETVTASEQVQQAVNRERVGSQLNLELSRNGKPLNLNVRAGALSPQS
ncbi:HhoA/HhoB/HtrA family serine endopeptidase [Limnoraphis robusta]|uniref:HhoA/HhoB/HtrA family serine endopeptidase n=1 Tax=Limnoraphis robusta CCNP1315 TaxID=3110306 RepID=A0ABU5TXS2_9CYAN|nr:HhoA/HhoB/HtrA family serine endopeptidase [Limnoraphis robusta]MEA5519288.1 HhoA/HhoB/HtrA family serine endopeptidase [Limnoraphis robusta CCNP1315]MEA5549030.1 HhoA/HhoB/HtrA family serine endopeptidase [Limnoraphis robusta CCNP1324]